MSESGSPQPQFTLSTAVRDKNNTLTNVNIPVPPEQNWMYLALDRQSKLLDKINGKLGFFTLILVLYIVLTVLNVLLSW